MCVERALRQLCAAALGPSPAPPSPNPLLVAPPFTCQGSPPIFNLINEGSPNGISLSYIGAPAYATDPFGCGGGNPPAVDPGTGLAPQRGLTIRLTCDKNQKTMSTPYFYESSTCQYVVYASSALACGSKGDPFDKPYTAADAFGFVVLGATLYFVCYIGACSAGQLACVEPFTAASQPSRVAHALTPLPSPPPLPPPLWQCGHTVSTSCGGSPSRRACLTCPATCPCGWAGAAACLRAATAPTSLWALRAPQRPAPRPSLPPPTAPLRREAARCRACNAQGTALPGFSFLPTFPFHIESSFV